MKIHTFMERYSIPVYLSSFLYLIIRVHLLHFRSDSLHFFNTISENSIALLSSLQAVDEHCIYPR